MSAEFRKGDLHKVSSIGTSDVGSGGDHLKERKERHDRSKDLHGEKSV